MGRSKKVEEEATPETVVAVADRVRALPENQGLNDTEMWGKIDEALSEATLIPNYLPVDSHQVD